MSAAQLFHTLEHTRHILDHVVLVGGVFVFVTVEGGATVMDGVVVDREGEAVLDVGEAGDASLAGNVVIPIADIRSNKQLRM